MFKGLLSRLLEALLFGALFESLAAGVIFYCLGTNSITYLQHIWQANRAYIGNNAVVNTYIWPFVAQWSVVYPTEWLNQISGSELGGSILVVLVLAAGIICQKMLITLMAVPLYGGIMIIAWYDGWVARELRRYRGGTESIRRETYEAIGVSLERLMFIGYVSLPLYIPAILWFVPLSAAVAFFHRMRLEFVQKYL